MKKILVIGAHFDDAELGAGGSMAKWVGEGKVVYKITLTDNITNFKYNDTAVDFESSKNESRKACEVLGVVEIELSNYAECTMLKFEKSMMQEIEQIIIEKEIDTLVCHYLHDIQQDHVSAAKISYVAGRYCDNIIMYQSNRYILPENFYPRYFVDITNEIDLKVKALDCYSESHDRNNKLFELTVEGNKIHGYSATKQDEQTYAEAFHLIKFVQR
jgi:LmbE family N-acetylglucosaminyl deacetylase